MIFSYIKVFQKLQAVRKSISTAALHGKKKEHDFEPSYINTVENTVTTTNMTAVRLKNTCTLFAFWYT